MISVIITIKVPDREYPIPITSIDMPSVPRQGEKIWIDLDGKNSNTFIVEAVTYNSFVVHKASGEIKRGKGGLAEVSFEQVEILVRMADGSIHPDHPLWGFAYPE